MRRFVFERTEDVSGVSGVGTVAEGIEFSDGHVVLSWIGYHSSTVIYQCMKDCESIHGHEGRTKIKWLDA